MTELAIRGIVAGALFLVTLTAAGCQGAPPSIIEAASGGAAAPQPQAPSTQAAVQEATPEPQPIGEADILARADVATASLRRIETLLRPAANMARIDAALDDREVTIEALRGDLDAVDPAQISVRRLEDMRFPWLELENELAAWSASTRARFDVLQRARDDLRAVRAQWELTLATADDVELAPELLPRVESVVGRSIDVETRVSARRNTVGAVSDRVAASQLVVSESLQRVDAVALEMRERLLSRDAPPLWQSLGAFEARAFAQNTVESGREWVRGLVDYLELRPARALFLVAWYFVLLLGATRLRRRSRGSSTSADAAGGARQLIERPFSVALAAALFTLLLFLPYPTGSAADVFFLLAIVPVTRLGSVVLEGNVRRALLAVAALTFVTRLAALGPDGSAGTRLSLLFVTGLALGLAVREMLRQRGTAPPRGWRHAVPTLTVIAAGIFAAALGANLLGWVQLSRMLTEASIASLFSAFAWAVAVAATASLMPVVIDGGLGRLLPSLRRNDETVIRVTVTTVGVIAVLGWLRSGTVRFLIREPMVDSLRRVAESAFSIGDLTISTGGLLGALFILAVSWLFARTVLFFLREEVLPRLSLRRGSGQSLVTLTNYTIWAIGIALAATAAGLTGTQLAVVVGALGVGIGFGLQTIVNNFVSGLILIFERPIKVGDAVQAPDFMGRVERIGIRASVIRSFDGAEIVVPNADLIAKAVANWTGSDENRRAEVLVGVAYGTDPERVLKILRRVANDHPLVLKNPEITAQMIRFGDSSLDFRLRCWTPFENWLNLVSDLHVAISRELEAAGITIPFQQHDVHIKEGRP